MLGNRIELQYCALHAARPVVDGGFNWLSAYVPCAQPRPSHDTSRKRTCTDGEDE